MRNYTNLGGARFSRDRILEIVHPQRSRINECLDHGVQAMQELLLRDPENSRFMDKSTKAHNTWSFITGHAREIFRGLLGVRWVEVRETNQRLLIVQDLVTIKFKKLNARMRASGIHTASFDLFNGQGSLMPDLYGTNLYAGYILDASGTVASRKLLVCPSGDKIEWVEELRAETARREIRDTDQRQRFNLGDEGEEGMAVAQ